MTHTKHSWGECTLDSVFQLLHQSISEIERSFGKQFSEDIQNIIPKEWSGPINSEYGSHLIFVNSISDSFTPTLKEINNIAHKIRNIVR